MPADRRPLLIAAFGRRLSQKGQFSEDECGTTTTSAEVGSVGTRLRQVRRRHRPAHPALDHYLDDSLRLIRRERTARDQDRDRRGDNHRLHIVSSLNRSRLLVSGGLWRRADLYQQRRGGFLRHVDDDTIADMQVR
jgi:hypothetical protein